MNTRAVTLHWSGKERALDASEARLREGRVYSAPDGRGALHVGDNLAVLRALAATHREKFTLAYLDPPFFTNRVHEATLRRSKERKSEPRIKVAAFDDRWPVTAS